MWLRRVLGLGSKDPLETAFGALEREVLSLLWAQDQLSVRDVQSRLPRRVAYTTVMTTLDRLYKKGVLTRVQAGRAFVYSPGISREDLQAAIASRVLTSLLQARGANAVPVLSNLVDTVEQHDAELLGTLEQMIRRKRRRLASGRTSEPPTPEKPRSR